MESPFRNLPSDLKLIETFGYRPDQGVPRQALHIDRLVTSAKTLGFRYDPAEITQRIEGIHADAPHRCRLTLTMAGDLALELAPMPVPLPQMRFAIAADRVASDDPFLRHKTTRRALYDSWRGNLPDGLQEWVFLNERDEVCEGTITNILITTPDGDRLTPPLSSGVLPGVYRQSLLNDGQLQEAVLTLSDLRAARAIHLTNSLRGSTAGGLVDLNDRHSPSIA